MCSIYVIECFDCVQRLTFVDKTLRACADTELQTADDLSRQNVALRVCFARELLYKNETYRRENFVFRRRRHEELICRAQNTEDNGKYTPHNVQCRLMYSYTVSAR